MDSPPEKKASKPRVLTVDDLLPFGHGNKAKMLMRHLDGVNAITEASGLKDPKFEKLRNMFIAECEKAMTQPDWRMKVYPCLYKTAFYATIVIYREALAKGQSVSRFRAEYIEFTDKAVKYLLQLQKTYPEVAYEAFLHMGDISRYSLDILKDNSKYDKALQYYSQAVGLEPQRGHTYNNIALLLNLHNKSNYWRSACLFLRSAICAEPFRASLESLRRMASKLPGGVPKVQIIAIEYVLAMQEEKFSSVILDEPKKMWNDAITAELNKDSPNRMMLVETFVIVVLGSIAALTAKDDTNNRTSYLIQSICDDFKRFFKDVATAEDPEVIQERVRNRYRQARARRAAQQSTSESETETESEPQVPDELPRRPALGEITVQQLDAQNNVPQPDVPHSGENGSDEDMQSTEADSASSESDSDDSSSSSATSSEDIPVFMPIPGTDLNKALLALLIEWFDHIDELLKPRQLNVGLRMTLQSVFQLLLDTANTVQSDFDMAALENEDEMIRNRVIWHIRTPAINMPQQYFNTFLPVLLDGAKEWDSFPIMFDKYYKAAPKKRPASPEVSDAVKQGRTLAKMRSLYKTDDSPPYTGFPSHVLVKADVMTTRLSVVRSIAAAGCTVLMTRSTMALFDKTKTKDAEVRAAVRFLEEAMKADFVRLVEDHPGNMYLIAHEFLVFEFRDDYNGLFVILSTGDKTAERILPPSKTLREFPVWTEGIDKFSERFAAELRVPRW
uniref:TPR_REGION domain-containing protein n=1 Tax=Panagrellus redivivus TaxID=6233 RepID=A0A7E4UPH4_PANRE